MCSHRITSLVPRPLPKFSLLVVQVYVGSSMTMQVVLMPLSLVSTDFPTQNQAAVLPESHNTHCDCNIARKQGMYVKTT